MPKSAVIALAVLVCGCVLAALAGPTLSLQRRTEALHQALGPEGTTATSVAVTSTWSGYASLQPGLPMSDDTITAGTSQIGGGLAGTPLPLAAGAWGSVTTELNGFDRPVDGIAARMEIVARDPLAGYLRVTAGTLSSASVPAKMVGVALTQQTATRFGLHLGSHFRLGGPPKPYRLVVTAIVRPRNPGSSFWATDPLTSNPALDCADTKCSSEFWDGGVIADPGELAALGALYCANNGCGNFRVQWEFPVATGSVNADQAQTLLSEVHAAIAIPPSLNAAIGDAATGLSISAPMAGPLNDFVSAQTAVLALLLLLFVSLIAVGVAVIMMAARMIVAGRQDELTMLRARGASSRQLATRMLRGVSVAVIPAAALGVALAIVLVSGSGTRAGGSAPLSWALTAVVLAIALLSPALIAVRRNRKATAPVNPARILTAEVRSTRFSAPAQRRLIAEVAACAAAIAGLAVLRGQGVPSAGSVNWYLTLSPILVAVPAAVIAFRLYPVVIRALLRLARRRAGATGYVALASSARTSLAAILPAFTLILALTLAAFAGMVNDAISRGQTTASWQATGADAVISTNPSQSPVTPAIITKIAAVPGVRHSTQVWTQDWTTPDGQRVSIVAVTPGQYAALTADTPLPPFPVADLAASPGHPGRPGPHTTIPVLASPDAAALIAHGAAVLDGPQMGEIMMVRVAGILTTTPAEPSGGTFVVLPFGQLPASAGNPPANLVLISGAGLNQGKLQAIVTAGMPAAAVTFRGLVLAGLQKAPLQRAAELLLLIGIIAAGWLGVANLGLGLALGARDRDLTLARLNVMGHQRPAVLAVLEALPAALTAVLAAAACALLLPMLTANALDLSVFTGTGAAVQVRPDLLEPGLEAGAALLLAGILLVAQLRLSRQRGVTGLLRST
jgi:putative ABC transport system permease protein